MSAANEETPTVHLGPVASRRNIFFAPDPEQPNIDERVFAVTGDCDLDKLAVMSIYLEDTGLFQRVTQGGVIVRILHQPSITWSTLVNFTDAQMPRNVPVVREKLGQPSDSTTALAYVIALLCEGAGWSATDVHIEEMPMP